MTLKSSSRGFIRKELRERTNSLEGRCSPHGGEIILCARNGSLRARPLNNRASCRLRHTKGACIPTMRRSRILTAGPGRVHHLGQY